MLLRPRCRRSKLMHSAEAEVVYQILAGASLLASFHPRRRLQAALCVQGSWLAGTTCPGLSYPSAVEEPAGSARPKLVGI